MFHTASTPTDPTPTDAFLQAAACIMPHDPLYQLDPDRLQQLARVTCVENVEHWAELDSTNSQAMRRVQQEAIRQPLLVVADRQTAGRGRGRNQWWAAPGALTFSMVLPEARLQVARQHIPKLSLTLGMAVCDALAQLLTESDPGDSATTTAGGPTAGGLGVKWPNDVLVSGRKISGILIEVAHPTEPTARGMDTDNQSEGRAGSCYVAGIGINVNNSLNQAPEAVRQMATSVSDLASPRDLVDVLETVLISITGWLSQLSAAPDTVLDRWDEYCLLYGQSVTLKLTDQTVAGVCRGVDGDGGLVLETAAGRRAFYGGVIGSRVWSQSE